MLMTSIFDARAALYDALRKRLETIAEKASTVPTAALIPGGNTPKTLFDKIAAAPFAIGNAFHIGYTDERLVPPDDPASNQGQAAPMLAALGMKDTNVLRVNTELPLEAAADDYHDAWQSFFAHDGALSLAVLGLGVDGHTCSLFSEAQINQCPQDRFAAAVTRNAGYDRVTVTPALLERARHVVFIVTGQEKASVVDAMLQPNNGLPATLATAHCQRVSLWYAPEAEPPSEC